MTRYEYECDKCHERHDDFQAMGNARQWLKCPDCGGRAHRVYSISLKTDTNNPLRKFSRQLGVKIETRADADRVFAGRNLVMASGRECDSAARDSRAEELRLDKVVRDGVREYNNLPDRLKQADAAKVAKDEAARPTVTAAPIQ